MSKLRKAMIDAMLVRGFAPRTHESYLSSVEGLWKYYKCPLVRLGTDQIQDYFLYLVKDRHLAPASCRLSLNGIRFLYKEVLHREFEAKIQVPKRPQRIPELLMRTEVAAILDACINHKHRMLLTVCYACGLRVSELRQAYQQGELERITRPGEVDRILDRLMGVDWVVKTKPWIRKTETVVKYLSRYTYRTAISDSRIGEISGGDVEVSYKDYQDNDRWKSLQLPGEELIRRFLLHVLPKGLMRIRHYGFLANRCRKQKLARIRQLLGQITDNEAADESLKAKENDWSCPKCQRGQMRVRLELTPIRFTGH